MSPRHSITAPAGGRVPCEAIRDLLSPGFAVLPKAPRVLLLVPDHTRSLPMLFRRLAETLADHRKAARLDFMVTLGTHPPLDGESLCHPVSQEARGGDRGVEGNAAKIWNVMVWFFYGHLDFRRPTARPD